MRGWNLNSFIPQDDVDRIFADQNKPDQIPDPADNTKLIHVADNLPASPDVLFNVSSLDSARNLFVVWALGAPKTAPAQRQIFVSAASAAPFH